jgi:hypothetical protein
MGQTASEPFKNNLDEISIGAAGENLAKNRGKIYISSWVSPPPPPPGDWPLSTPITEMGRKKWVFIRNNFAAIPTGAAGGKPGKQGEN